VLTVKKYNYSTKTSEIIAHLPKSEKINIENRLAQFGPGRYDVFENYKLNGGGRGKPIQTSYVIDGFTKDNKNNEGEFMPGEIEAIKSVIDSKMEVLLSKMERFIEKIDKIEEKNNLKLTQIETELQQISDCINESNHPDYSETEKSDTFGPLEGLLTPEIMEKNPDLRNIISVLKTVKL